MPIVYMTPLDSIRNACNVFQLMQVLVAKFATNKVTPVRDSITWVCCASGAMAIFFVFVVTFSHHFGVFRGTENAEVGEEEIFLSCFSLNTSHIV